MQGETRQCNYCSAQWVHSLVAGPIAQRHWDTGGVPGWWGSGGNGTGYWRAGQHIVTVSTYWRAGLKVTTAVYGLGYNELSLNLIINYITNAIRWDIRGGGQVNT